MTSRDLRTAVSLALLLTICLWGPMLFAQASQLVTGGATASPAQSETSEWGSSEVWAFLSTSGLEWLKRQGWFTLLTDRTSWWTQRTLGFVLACATALGIHFSFSADTGTLVITGLMGPALFQAGRDILRQFVFNEITYRVAVKPYPGARG